MAGRVSNSTIPAAPAPASEAAIDNSSTSSAVSTFSGMATSAPTMLRSENSGRINAGQSSRPTPIGTTATSMSRRSNHGF